MACTQQYTVLSQFYARHSIAITELGYHIGMAHTPQHKQWSTSASPKIFAFWGPPTDARMITY